MGTSMDDVDRVFLDQDSFTYEVFRPNYPIGLENNINLAIDNTTVVSQCGKSPNSAIDRMSQYTNTIVATASSTYSDDTKPFKAFDGHDDTYWQANVSTAPYWLKIKLENPIAIHKFSLYCNTDIVQQWKIEASNDNTQWDTIFSANHSIDINQLIFIDVIQGNIKFPKTYLYYQFKVYDAETTTTLPTVSHFQLYPYQYDN